jgi:hypothetical protein
MNGMQPGKKDHSVTHTNNIEQALAAKQNLPNKQLDILVQQKIRGYIHNKPIP